MRWRGKRSVPADEARRFRDRARVAMAAGEVDAAIEALGQAALLHPEAADLHVELGALFHGAGRIEAARRAYERALDADPSHHDARVAANALPPEPPGRSNFTVGELLQGGRGTTGGDITRYRVTDVRRGGFGAVYIVEAVEDNARLALKSFDARLLWSDEDRRRFLIEATTWISLDPHPNVVTAKSVELVEGFPCLVMDYIDGGDLADRLAGGPLSARTALNFGMQICDGMEHARRQLGLVHRDLKPSNCMLTRSGTVKITDFGLARALRDAQETSLGLPGKYSAGRALYTTVAGTPVYMAPEQFELGAHMDIRTDVFAFGVMLFQMLSGRLPPVGRVHRQVDRWRMDSPVGSVVTGIVRGCVDPDPDRRPATFGHVRQELEAVYRRLTKNSAPVPLPPEKVSRYTWVERSVAFRNLSLPEQALAAADRGLALAAAATDDALRGGLWQVRGLALVDLNRRTEALDAYDQALEFTAEEPTAWISKAAALAGLGRFEEALACLDRCLGIVPEHPAALAMRATCLSDLGRTDEAEQAFRLASGQNPRDVGLLANFSRLLQEQEHYGESLQRIEEALAIAPRYSHGWSRLGNLLAATGEIDDALSAFDRAVEIDPDNPITWAFRGDALREAGRSAEALACYERAVALDPNDPAVQARRDLLLH